MPNVLPASDRCSYVISDPETQGVYDVRSKRPKSQAELDQLIASVIADEGRVRSGVTRIILVD
jgi:hypothetical protein